MHVFLLVVDLDDEESLPEYEYIMMSGEIKFNDDSFTNEETSLALGQLKFLDLSRC
jgi:hypothetical protein